MANITNLRCIHFTGQFLLTFIMDMVFFFFFYGRMLSLFFLMMVLAVSFYSAGKIKHLLPYLFFLLQQLSQESVQDEQNHPEACL